METERGLLEPIEVGNKGVKSEIYSINKRIDTEGGQTAYARGLKNFDDKQAIRVDIKSVVSKRDMEFDSPSVSQNVSENN